MWLKYHNHFVFNLFSFFLNKNNEVRNKMKILFVWYMIIVCSYVIIITIIIGFKIFENVEMKQLSFPPHLETVTLGLFGRATSTDGPSNVDNSIVITNYFSNSSQSEAAGQNSIEFWSVEI